MTDDDALEVAPRDAAGDARYGEALLYDFAKFLITLPLLVLGGMLTLAQAARTGEIKLVNIVLILATLSLAATTAFSVAHSLVDARAAHREPRAGLPRLLKISTGLLGIGVGGFVSVWVDTLT